MAWSKRKAKLVGQRKWLRHDSAHPWEFRKEFTPVALYRRRKPGFTDAGEIGSIENIRFI